MPIQISLQAQEQTWSKKQCKSYSDVVNKIHKKKSNETTEINKTVDAREDRQQKMATFMYISNNTKIPCNTNVHLAYETNT
jgi:hypothetical protein